MKSKLGYKKRNKIKSLRNPCNKNTIFTKTLQK